MRALKLFLALTLVAVLGAPAGALATEKETEQYNQATMAFNLGEFEKAATLFAELADEASMEGIRLPAEYFVGQAFFKAGYYDAAFRRFSYVISAGPSHPQYLSAVKGVVAISEALDEDFITGALLDKEYNDDFGKLDPEVLNKINYIVGAVTYRKDRRDDALSFFQTVPSSSPAYARARYLTGLIHARAAIEVAPPEDAELYQKAIGIFEELLKLKNNAAVSYTALENVQQLSRLALARVQYGLGNFAESVAYYDAVPRFSDFWDEALAEAGWSKFQAQDFGGALGSLQALHAPQFAGSFQPESWILKATVYFETCLFDDAKASIEGFEKVYLPMQEQLKPVLQGNKSNQDYYEMLAAKSKTLPRAVKGYLLSNQKLVKFKSLIEQLDREKAMVKASPMFKGKPLGTEILAGIEQSRDLQVRITGSFVKSRISDAQRMIAGFQGQAELLRFEIFKGEGEVLAQRADQSNALKKQPIYRPAMPGAAWEYWQFNGEFWLDEIGYYSYTMKSGCLTKKED